MISNDTHALWLIKALDEPTFIISPDFVILHINQKVFDLTGRKGEEITGKTFQEVLGGLIRTIPDDPLLISKASKSPAATRVVLQDTGKEWLAKSTPVYDESGELAYFLYSFRDMVNPEQFQNTLRLLHEKENLIDSLYTTIPTGVGIIRDRIFRLVNDHFCLLVGYDREEIIGRSSEFLYLSHEEFLEMGVRIYREVNRKGKGVETMWKTKNNKIIHVLIQVSYLNREDNSYIFSTLDITRSKQYERKLKESEARYKSIFYDSSAPMLIIDPETDEIFDANNAALRYYGYTKEQMLCLHINEINIMSVEDIKNEMTKAREHRKFLFYFKHRLSNGQIRDVEVHSGPVVFNEKPYLLSIIQDISVQKQQEVELQDLATSLIKAQEIARLGSWAYDPETGDVVWSAELFKILGYDPNSFQPTMQRLFDAVHPADKEEAVRSFETFLKEKTRYTSEVRIERPDNQVVYVQCFGESMDRDQKIIFTGAVLDITERKKAEFEIEEKSLFFNSVISNLQEGVIVYDMDMKVILWNKRMEEVTGKRSSEVVGCDVYNLFPHVQKEGLDKLIEKAFQNEIVVSHDILYERDNGESMWYYATFSPNYSSKGKIVGVIEVVAEITDRKKAEFKEIERNEELFKANTELDNFVYRVSHDLRAPISSSLGLSRISLSENSVEVLHRYARLQEKSLEKLDRFIKDILDYSRNSRIEVIPQNIPLKDIVENVLEQLNKLPENQRIQITMDIQQECPFYSDKLRVEIILNNIISNAFKFQNVYHEDPYVNIFFKIDEKQGQFIVEDNGIGIAPEHQHKVFDMFYRATAARPGSGIGLYIVQDCVKKMNGEISMESKINYGSRFTIILPNLLKPD